MNKKSILLLTSTIALAGIGFYFYKKRQTRLAYEKSVQDLTEEFNVFN
jgi:hypothetical protein